MPILVKSPDDRLSLLMGRLIMEREALVAKLEELQEQLAKEKPKDDIDGG